MTYQTFLKIFATTCKINIPSIYYIRNKNGALISAFTLLLSGTDNNKDQGPDSVHQQEQIIKPARPPPTFNGYLFVDPKENTVTVGGTNFIGSTVKLFINKQNEQQIDTIINQNEIIIKPYAKFMKGYEYIITVDTVSINFIYVPSTLLN